MKTPEIYERVGDYVIRRATLSDFEAIINIDDNIFDGTDYLSAMYYIFIQSEKYLVLVSEDHGIPVKDRQKVID